MANLPPLFEICVDSVLSAINAEKSGAARIELCDNLIEGGTTPSSGMITTARKYVQIPIMVMIRPRGGDFCYTNYEFEVMCLDIQHAKNLGADGVVFGILRQDGSVDAERVSKLVKLAQPMQVTFHRAFDLTKDPLKSLEEIISIGGIQRILTSGQNDTVLEGLEMIESLVKHAKGRIIILPGGGIRESNIKRILSEVKLTELHVSASRLVRSVMEHQIINIHMGRAFYSDEYLLNAFDPHKFQNLKSIADQF